MFQQLVSGPVTLRTQRLYIQPVFLSVTQVMMVFFCRPWAAATTLRTWPRQPTCGYCDCYGDSGSVPIRELGALSPCYFLRLLATSLAGPILFMGGLASRACSVGPKFRSTLLRFLSAIGRRLRTRFTPDGQAIWFRPVPIELSLWFGSFAFGAAFHNLELP